MENKVSVIMRCCNRLEYTIQSINKILKTKCDTPMELILVDNASADWTQQRVERVIKNTDYYKDIIYLRLEENVWDRYGMREWLNVATGNYIVQVDNDIEVPYRRLDWMLYVLENTEYKIVMFKRTGVNLFLEPSTREEIGEFLVIGKIQRPVACYMCSRDVFDRVDWSRPWHESKYQLASLVDWMVCKILNMFCQEIEWRDWETYLQHEKYNYNERKQFI